jgi:hypothetical protein
MMNALNLALLRRVGNVRDETGIVQRQAKCATLTNGREDRDGGRRYVAK